jgi:tetratricopeptide (TPR) repeat protein
MERINKIKEMLRENPQDSFLEHALALECIKLGNDEEAKRLFQNLLNREPGYIGSYYHLSKLLERIGETDEAVKWYEKGMQEAKRAGDNHALSELRSAYEELTF